MDTDVKTLIDEARKLSRTFRAKVMNCVDGSGESDKDWLSAASLLTRLCDTIEGTPAEVRCAIEFAVLFGVDPEMAEKMKDDPKFIQSCKESAERITGVSKNV